MKIHSKKLYLLTKYLPSILEFEIAHQNPGFIRSITPRPYTATFNLTDNCNSRCITCAQWRKKSSDELTTTETKGILEQLSQTTVRNVHFGGGEPMLRRDIFELVRYASNLGFNSSMVTNGLLINYERAKRLVESGLDNVYVSVDGPESIHDSIRGIKGAYLRTLNALKVFLNLKQENQHIKVNIATTIMKPTLNSIMHVVNLAEVLQISISFSLIDFNPYFFKGVDSQDLWISEQNKLDEVVNCLIVVKRRQPHLISNSIQSLEYARHYFKDPLRRDVPCHLGFIELFFGAHGELYPCWALPSIGNLREKKLSNILDSELYKNKLCDMWMKNCPGCACGYISNLDYDSSALLREFSMLPRFTLKRMIKF